eukprot:2349537-Prymnesium_polylepis.1
MDSLHLDIVHMHARECTTDRQRGCDVSTGHATTGKNGVCDMACLSAINSLPCTLATGGVLCQLTP